MRLVNIHLHVLVFLLASLGLFQAEAQVWSLQKCLDTAQVYNRNLQMGRNNQAISKEKEQEARAGLIPKVNANADYRYFTNLPYQLMPLSTFNPAAPPGEFREIQFGVPHNLNANIQLTMPLYNPQVYGAIKNTQIASEIVALQLKKTEEQVYFEISGLYYNAQILQQQIAFIDSNLINADRLLSNMRLLNQQLLVKGSDVDKIKLQVSQLNTQKDIAQIKLQQVLNALKFSMGLSLDHNLQIEATVQRQSEMDYTYSFNTELSIISTQNGLLKNELSVLNRSRYLPSLNLFATYGTSGFGYNGEPSSFLNFYPIGFAGVQLTYPLFNGTVTQKRIEQKKFELMNNEITKEHISVQTNMKIENAQLQREIANKTIETTAEQVALAHSIYEQTVVQQRNGTASLADVLLADNALRESQQGYISALVEYLKSDLELKMLTGNISKHH